MNKKKSLKEKSSYTFRIIRRRILYVFICSYFECRFNLLCLFYVQKTEIASSSTQRYYMNNMVK